MTYSCAADHENWGILGWGASGQEGWINGPGYSADSKDSTRKVTQTFSVKYLRRMMKLTPESNISYLNLGAYSDGRIEELVLHVGSRIPREDSLFKDGAPNESWICTDIERILDTPDEKYLCVEYTCATSDYEGWTVLTWGVSVDGEWRNGPSYKVSGREATRKHFFSMRMDAFRRMLHLSWDAKIDTIQLSAYNDGRILDIWISDTKVTDPGDSRRDRVRYEREYSSKNQNVYNQVFNEEGKKFPQDLTLEPWGWGDLDDMEEIIRLMGDGSYVLITYEAEDGVEPNLQFTMADGSQQGATPTCVAGNKALFSYRDIQGFLAGYLVPQEIANMQVSSGDGAMKVTGVTVVTNQSELAADPIAVLTKSWEGFHTQLSKFHSDYEPGDTVKVTVTFDKVTPAAIAFNLGGQWNSSDYTYGNTVTRTARPDDDNLWIQLGQMPETKKFVMITDIRVEIKDKINFNDLVLTEGNPGAGMLASTEKEAATAVLTADEINRGVKVVFETEKTDLSGEEQQQLQSIFGDEEEKIRTAAVSDITIYKEEGTERTKVTQTDDPVRFKVPVPDELQGKGYDFAVIRFHEGEIPSLEDLDGNEKTVTFASSRFSKFAIVYGEEGAFDGQSGALKVFRSQWNGWQTGFSQYNSKFKPGRETKVTLTFDCDVRSYMDYNNPDWTRVEDQDTGKTFTAVLTPTDDSLTVGIADLNGNSTAKLLNVKVEQEQEKLGTITGTDQSIPLVLSEHNPSFVAGKPVTVTLTFDREVVAGIRYTRRNEDGTAETATETAPAPGKTFTWTITPADGTVEIFVTDMKGSTSVSLLEAEVRQAIEPVYIFRHSWGAEGDSYSDTISAHCRETYEVGDRVRITAVFDKSSQAKLMVTSGNTEEAEITATGTKIVLETTPGTDGFTIQAADDSKLPLGLLDVTVEIIEKAEPPEGLHRFMAAWAGFETALSEYNPDFKVGEETTVTLTFDKEVKAQGAFKTATSDWDVREGTGKEMTLTVTPKEDYVNIQITDMAGEPAVTLLSVKVEQKQKPAEEALHEFTAAYDGFEPTLSAYNPDFQPGLETTVTLIFDKEAKAQGAFKTENSNWDVQEGTGKEIVLTVVPKEDYINIQITDMAGETSIKLLSVKVEQKQKPAEEPLHEFTAAWAGFEPTLSAYNPDFQPGLETTVTLTFDKEAKAQGAFKTESSDWDVKAGTGKEIVLTVVPREDYINIQITDMAGETSIKLLSVKVEQKQKPAEEPLHEFTAAWAGFEPTLSAYNPDFQPGLETTVTLIFDKEAQAQGAFKTESSDWDVKAGTGKEIVLTVVPKEDYINIQITDMGGETSINLLAVKVEQAAANNLLMADLGFIVEEDPIHVFTEPETVILQLTDYSENYEEGQNVTVDMALISDGPFTVMIGEADLTQGTASDASRRKATSSDAQKDSRARTYESDEDCMAVVQWKGRPKSGAIAVTILEMEGTQVVIDYISAEGRETSESSENTGEKPGSGAHSSASGTGPERTENAAEAEDPGYSGTEAEKPGDTGTETGDTGNTGTEIEKPGAAVTETGEPESTGTEDGDSGSTVTETEDPGAAREENGEAESSEPETQSPGACTPEEERSEGSGQEDDGSEKSESEDEEDKDSGQESGESEDSGSEDPQSDSRPEEE